MAADSAAYALALLATPGVGRKTAIGVLREFPSLENLANAPASRRRIQTNRGRTSVDLLAAVQEEMALTEQQVKRHRDCGIEPMALSDPRYPALLARIDDPPVVLFVRGHVEALENNCVAVIGTRRPTQIGVEVAERVTRFLVASGCTIVAGLARGIDTAAHRATVAVRGRTIAVMAEGLDRIYPPENRDLAEEIVATGGALVSEVPLGSRAYRASFVERDRLQSGLSLAVIPIQTDVEGGTMHTVRFAERQARFIACPQPVASEESAPQWAGIHHLIAARRAWCFTKADYAELAKRILEARPTPKTAESAEMLADLIVPSASEPPSLGELSPSQSPPLGPQTEQPPMPTFPLLEPEPQPHGPSRPLPVAEPVTAVVTQGTLFPDASPPSRTTRKRAKPSAERGDSQKSAAAPRRPRIGRSKKRGGTNLK